MKLMTIAMTAILLSALNSFGAQAQRIVFFGDSITAYRGSLKVASFQVADALKSEGRKALVFNSGCPGATTVTGKSRFAPDVAGLYPDLAIIMFGTNDAAIDVHRGRSEPRVSPEKYEQNLQIFIDELKKCNCAVVLMTPPPMYLTEKLRKYYGKEPYLSKGFNFMVDKYCEIVRQTARKNKVELIDVNKIFRQAAQNKYENLPELFADGMHPNQRGQTLIAKAIMKLLKKNEQLLQNRSAQAAGVAVMDIKKPQHGSSSGKNPAFAVAAPKETVALQYRFKAHYGKGRKKTFGDWLKLKFTVKNQLLTGTIPELLPRMYSLQFRALNSRGRTISLGGVADILIR